MESRISMKVDRKGSLFTTCLFMLRRKLRKMRWKVVTLNKYSKLLLEKPRKKQPSRKSIKSLQRKKDNAYLIQCSYNVILHPQQSMTIKNAFHE